MRSGSAAPWFSDQGTDLLSEYSHGNRQDWKGFAR
jgi:hypothetical protein